MIYFCEIWRMFAPDRGHREHREAVNWKQAQGHKAEKKSKIKKIYSVYKNVHACIHEK